MKIKLCEFGPARSIRVRWTLQELGVEFESVRVNHIAGEHQRHKFLKDNPAGRIPVFVDGDLVLAESVGIVLTRRKSFPKNLLPADLLSYMERTYAPAARLPRRLRRCAAARSSEQNSPSGADGER